MAFDEEVLSLKTGLLGELLVEIQLVERGWHPLRLDTAQMAPNADLLAINQRQRISIQVKTTNAVDRHAHSEFLGFGYSTNYLKDGKDIFNSKKSPLKADVIIAVSYRGQTGSRFVILPVVLAEALCRRHCDKWYSVPTRTQSGKRSSSFPIYLCFNTLPRTHTEHHALLKQNLLAFENRWDVLFLPIEQLHDPDAWPIIGI